MPKRSRSASICAGLRNTCFVHIGRGFLPLLAVMLLAAPQLAFAQGSLAVTVNPRTLDIDEGDNGMYAVVLDTDPGEDVEVRVKVVGALTANTAEIYVESSGGTTQDDGSLVLTFNGGATGTWDDEQSVTVHASEDADAVDEAITLTHTAVVVEDGDEEDVALSRVTVAVRVDDNDTKSVTLSANAVEFEEATQTGTYEVVLGSEPTDTVTVDVAGASGEITASPSRLFFTPQNYTEAQTVTVFAGEDFDGEDDTATLTHTVRGGDYTGVSVTPAPGTVTVTVEDNDPRGVTVSTNELNIAVGVSATYSIVLNTQPTRTVVIKVAEDSEDLRVTSGSSLSFTTSNWDQPHNVTVRVESDAATGGPLVTLTHAVDGERSSRDEGYDDESVGNVEVTISAAQPGFTLDTSRLSIAEGTSKKYRVRLASAPSNSVDVAVSVPTDSDLSVDSESQSLTFTDEDWNTYQEVTVTAAEDADAVTDTGTIAHTIDSVTATRSNLPVTITENDTRGVKVTPTSLEVTEGATATYSIVLDSQPTDNVTVTVSGASGDVTVDPSQRTFTTANWFEAQEVEVSAAEDPDGEPDGAVTLTHTVRGGDYDRQRGVDNVTVTIVEKQTRGITATPDSLTIMEGEKATYRVRLDAQPTGTVTVTVRGATGDVTVDPARLIFTTSTWMTGQPVEVKVGQDADGVEDADVTLTHAASGGGYDVTGGTVTVTPEDDDEPGVTVTPRALTVTEGSSSAYTVVLNTEPTRQVTVTLGGLDMAGMQSLVVTPPTLTFDHRNWRIPKTVTVMANEDNDGTGTPDGSPVRLTHSISGGEYDDVSALDVSVTVRDNDTVGVTVKPRQLEIPQGSSRTYTVVLNTKPTGDVTVTVTAPSGVTASPSPLTFTSDNWATPRTVTVHVGPTATPTPEADLEDPPTLSNAITSGDTLYNALAAVRVQLVIKDSGAPGVAVNPTSLSITEGESASYTVVLTKAPTATVYVDIDVSGEAGDMRLSRRSLTFSTSNWNREQMVTVSLAEDDDQAQDAAVTLTHSVRGADEYEDMDPDTDGEQPVTVSSVALTFIENDTRGVTVTPTALTIAAGTSGTYRVRLNTQPTDTVTVTADSPTKDVTVTGSPLIFETNNWNSAQTVTVMVDEDAGGEEVSSVTLEHTVTGGDYAGVGVSAVTVTIPVEGAASAPTGLTATGGDQRVTLRWGAPSSDGGSAIVRYQYRYQESGSGFNDWANVPGGASASSHTVSGLENGTAYTFEVRAVNGVGGGQGATASATLADSVPGAPANLVATGGDGQVALTWGAPDDGGSQILRYEYRYAASGETYSDWMTVSGAGTARSVTVSGLTNGTLYGFEVRAENSVGEGEASQASATPGRAPSMPTGLTARVESETITVMWGMPADNGGSAITGYQVRYRMNGGQWSNWMAVAGGASATSYTMTGLTNGIGHEIEVRAVNAIGTGASASVEATPMEGIDFAHFANGQSTGVTITSDIVLVNVETSTVTPAIYFYNQMGEMIPADSVVDLMGGLEMAGDGSLAVPMGIAGRGEMTISTNGEGALVIGSVRVFGSGRLGGVLRFDIPFVGVAGVGASEPVNDAIFPARRMVGGINTGAAIRNLSAEPMTVTCMLMQGGDVMDTEMVRLAGDGHSSEFIHEMFPGSNTTDFVGSVRCTAADGGMFAGVALELDAPNGIFTTLPVVPLNTGSDSGESMLNFAHFANGDFAGTATSSDLVFVNVASSAVSPAIYFYDQMGNMIDASMVVDAMMDGVEVDSDGALMVMDEIPPMGEMTISTSGMGEGMIGSVRVVSDGPIGGVLRFDIPNFGVAGVGASEAVNAAIFPARRVMNGINTGAAIRNLMAEMTTVTCRLMKGGNLMGENPIELPGNGQNSEFINELFPNANTDDFEGSVHCTAPAGSMFTGVALEMDFNNRIFTTLPVVPVR